MVLGQQSERDPFVQKEGRGPSSAELTGEDYGGERKYEYKWRPKTEEAKKDEGSPEEEELSEEKKQVVILGNLCYSVMWLLTYYE